MKEELNGLLYMLKKNAFTVFIDEFGDDFLADIPKNPFRCRMFYLSRTRR